MDDASLRRVIEEHTALSATPLVPEIRLFLATEITPLWHASESLLAKHGLEPPFWAFAWAGGQAIARYLLDQPACARGAVVLDLASGSGLCALAAARAGAQEVFAVDTDPMARAAIAMNADSLEVSVRFSSEDLLDAPRLPAWAEGATLVLAGDVCYDAKMTERVLPWLRARAAEGRTVLLGDPGRAYLPSRGLEELARYRVPVSDDVEGAGEKWGVVYRVHTTVDPT